MLQKIVNVYQVQFIDFKAPGFGDYLRGCFTMMQIIDTLNEYCNTNVTFDMDLSNHPMSQVILTEGRNPAVAYAALGNFHIDVLEVKKEESDIAFQHILGQTVDYMNKLCLGQQGQQGQLQHNGTFYTFCCKFAIYKEFLPRHKELVKSKLIPTEAMASYIDSVKESMGIRDGQYSVIHVRCGDESSFPHSFARQIDGNFIEKVKKLIADNTGSDKYILITNNDTLRGALNIPSWNPRICHTGQDSKQSFESIRDTMTDFFIMSKALSIVAFSPYYHGTGFSMECAKVYDIPYKVVKIV
jgi:hypothetical protein